VWTAQYPEAERLLRAHAAQSSNSALVRGGLIRSLWGQERYSEALELAITAAGEFPDEPRFALWAGALHSADLWKASAPPSCALVEEVELAAPLVREASSPKNPFYEFLEKGPAQISAGFEEIQAPGFFDSSPTRNAVLALLATLEVGTVPPNWYGQIRCLLVRAGREKNPDLAAYAAATAVSLPLTGDVSTIRPLVLAFDGQPLRGYVGVQALLRLAGLRRLQGLRTEAAAYLQIARAQADSTDEWLLAHVAEAMGENPTHPVLAATSFKKCGDRALKFDSLQAARCYYAQGTAHWQTAIRAPDDETLDASFLALERARSLFDRMGHECAVVQTDIAYAYTQVQSELPDEYARAIELLERYEANIALATKCSTPNLLHDAAVQAHKFKIQNDGYRWTLRVFDAASRLLAESGQTETSLWMRIAALRVIGKQSATSAKVATLEDRARALEAEVRATGDAKLKGHALHAYASLQGDLERDRVSLLSEAQSLLNGAGDTYAEALVILDQIAIGEADEGSLTRLSTLLGPMGSVQLYGEEHRPRLDRARRGVERDDIPLPAGLTRELGHGPHGAPRTISQRLPISEDPVLARAHANNFCDPLAEALPHTRESHHTSSSTMESALWLYQSAAQLLQDAARATTAHLQSFEPDVAVHLARQAEHLVSARTKAITALDLSIDACLVSQMALLRDEFWSELYSGSGPQTPWPGPTPWAGRLTSLPPPRNSSMCESSLRAHAALGNLDEARRVAHHCAQSALDQTSWKSGFDLDPSRIVGAMVAPLLAEYPSASEALVAETAIEELILLPFDSDTRTQALRLLKWGSGDPPAANAMINDWLEGAAPKLIAAVLSQSALDPGNDAHVVAAHQYLQEGDLLSHNSLSPVVAAALRRIAERLATEAEDDASREKAEKRLLKVAGGARSATLRWLETTPANWRRMLTMIKDEEDVFLNVPAPEAMFATGDLGEVARFDSLSFHTHWISRAKWSADLREARDQALRKMAEIEVLEAGHVSQVNGLGSPGFEEARNYWMADLALTLEQAIPKEPVTTSAELNDLFTKEHVLYLDQEFQMYVGSGGEFVLQMEPLNEEDFVDYQDALANNFEPNGTDAKELFDAVFGWIEPQPPRDARILVISALPIGPVGSLRTGEGEFAAQRWFLSQSTSLTLLNHLAKVRTQVRPSQISILRGTSEAAISNETATDIASGALGRAACVGKTSYDQLMACLPAADLLIAADGYGATNTWFPTPSLPFQDYIQIERTPSHDSKLRAMEIAGLGTAMGHVTLVVCDAANLSLSWAFLVGGADSVLSSAWKLPQGPETETFVKLFYWYYEQEGRTRKDVALGNAQRDAIERGLPTQVWAGWVLMGLRD